MTTPIDFMHSLTVGLFHRWESDRLFMLLTAYIDESGTHGDSPLTIMAGYVGHSGQWRKFDKKWVRTLSKLELTHFHAKDFIRRRGEFKGWDATQSLKLIDRIDDICRRHGLFGFVASLRNSDYDEFYIGEGRPRKIQADSRYGLCFRLCMMFLPEMIKHIVGDKEVTLHIVMESGHKNAGDVVRIFDLFKKQASPEFARMAGTLTFADKKECYGIQAADSLAFSAFRVEQKDNVPVVPFTFKDDSWDDLKKYAKGPRPCFRLSGTPHILRELRDNLTVQVLARRKHWLAGGTNSFSNEQDDPASVSAK